MLQDSQTRKGQCSKNADTYGLKSCQLSNSDLHSPDFT